MINDVCSGKNDTGFTTCFPAFNVPKTGPLKRVNSCNACGLRTWSLCAMSDPLWPTPQVDGMDRALRVWKPKHRPTCSQSWTGCFLIDARDALCDSPLFFQPRCCLLPPQSFDWRRSMCLDASRKPAGTPPDAGNWAAAALRAVAFAADPIPGPAHPCRHPGLSQSGDPRSTVAQ